MPALIGTRIVVWGKKAWIFFWDGGTQDASIVWKDLTGAGVVIGIGGIAVGFGANAMLSSPPEATIARTCYLIAALIAFAKIIHYFSIKRIPRLYKMLFSFALCGLVGMLLTLGFSKVSQRQSEYEALKKHTEEPLVSMLKPIQPAIFLMRQQNNSLSRRIQ